MIGLIIEFRTTSPTQILANQNYNLRPRTAFRLSLVSPATTRQFPFYYQGAVPFPEVVRNSIIDCFACDNKAIFVFVFSCFFCFFVLFLFGLAQSITITNAFRTFVGQYFWMKSCHYSIHIPFLRLYIREYSPNFPPTSYLRHRDCSGISAEARVT